VLQNVARKRLELRDARLAHERRVGGQTLDDRVGIQFEHPFFVRAVGEDFYFQVFECAHN